MVVEVKVVLKVEVVLKVDVVLMVDTVAVRSWIRRSPADGNSRGPKSFTFGKGFKSILGNVKIRCSQGYLVASHVFS